MPSKTVWMKEFVAPVLSFKYDTRIYYTVLVLGIVYFQFYSDWCGHCRSFVLLFSSINYSYILNLFHHVFI